LIIVKAFVLQIAELKNDKEKAAKTVSVFKQIFFAAMIIILVSPVIL